MDAGSPASMRTLLMLSMVRLFSLVRFDSPLERHNTTTSASYHHYFVQSICATSGQVSWNVPTHMYETHFGCIFGSTFGLVPELKVPLGAPGLPFSSNDSADKLRSGGKETWFESNRSRARGWRFVLQEGTTRLGFLWVSSTAQLRDSKNGVQSRAAPSVADRTRCLPRAAIQSSYSAKGASALSPITPVPYGVLRYHELEYPKWSPVTAGASQAKEPHRSC